MTEKNTNLEFVKYRLTWGFTDDGDLQESFFWLPKDIEPSEYVGAILSVVELSASEYGYKYTLEEVKEYEPVIVTGLVSRVLDAVDKANEKFSKEELGHFGYTSKDGDDFENQEVDRMSEDYSARVESDAMDWVDDHEREIANHFEAFEPW